MSAEAAPKAKKAPKPKPSHPSYVDMVTEAIVALKERSGSSVAAIRKYVGDHYGSKLTGAIPWEKTLSHQLKRMTENGKLVKVKASYKLGEELKKASKKKPVRGGRAKLMPAAAVGLASTAATDHAPNGPFGRCRPAVDFESAIVMQLTVGPTSPPLAGQAQGREAEDREAQGWLVGVLGVQGLPRTRRLCWGAESASPPRKPWVCCWGAALAGAQAAGSWEREAWRLGGRAGPPRHS